MRKIAAAAVMVALVASPAFAQGNKKGSSTNEWQKMQDEQRARENKDVDKAYSETMKRSRGQAAPAYDPWGNVRPADKK